MGLTLHYTLTLDATLSADEVAERLRQLHAVAQTLPVEQVLPLVREELASLPEMDEHWLSLEFWASIIAEPMGGASPQRRGVPESTIGFTVYLGEGSEAANFAVMRSLTAADTLGRWFWAGFCKTQYASSVSEEHFLRCHTSLVTLLDHAQALGFAVEVHDEGGFWEDRDEQALLAEVRRMNHLVAGFAGGLLDALGDDGKLEAPIFEHPRFERLEMGLEE